MKKKEKKKENKKNEKKKKEKKRENDDQSLMTVQTMLNIDKDEGFAEPAGLKPYAPDVDPDDDIDSYQVCKQQGQRLSSCKGK